MDNNLLQIKIKQRLNKLASFDYDNLECWMVQEAVNKAQLAWFRRMIYGLNTRKQGTESSTGLIDDLRVFLKDHKVNYTTKDLYNEGTIPDDYLYYVRTDVMAKSDCCPERKMTVYLAEEANMGVLLTSNTKGPSFEWAETLATMIGNKIRVYTNNEFSVTDMKLVYYRKPREVHFVGCMNPSTGESYKADQTLEFKDDVAELIVDEAAAILAGDIEAITQYQRNSQNVQTNS